MRGELALLPDGRGEFAVRDSGPGIAAEHIPRLTERFYRVDRSRSRETGGTGLGLAIVKHVAQRHGAELRIESTPGEGSSFALVFPAAPRAARVGAQRRAPDGPPQQRRKSSAVSAQRQRAPDQKASGDCMRRPGPEAAVGQQVAAAQAHAPQQHAIRRPAARTVTPVAAQHEHAQRLRASARW